MTVGVHLHGHKLTHSSRNALILCLLSLHREFILLYSLHQCQLLGIAAAYGDLQAVRYLLKEALVALPTEPNDDNAAVVAAYFGHKDIVKELLDSLHGKTIGLPLPFLKLFGGCVL